MEKGKNDLKSHSELVSESNVNEILKQVKDDVYYSVFPIPYIQKNKLWISNLSLTNLPRKPSSNS